MLAFSINQENIKDFMQKLLKTETFDKLEVRSVYLETIVKYEIMGNINKDYLKEGESRFFVEWRELKPYVLNLIQGNKKPKVLKIVFSLKDEVVLKLDENGKAMFLNLVYENNEITGTTGTSQKNFSLDKKLDIIWEDSVLKFFKKNNINYTIL